MTEQDQADELFGLPLDAFTAARDSLAAELRRAGDKAEAARVKKLRKPSLAAWAVNQVARRDPAAIGRLLELRDQIEAAADGEQVRAATDDRRRLIARLVADADAVLSEGGHATAAGTRQAITQSLHAGDDESDREDLRRGRLTHALQPSGFGASAWAPEAPDTVSDPKVEEALRRADQLALEAEGAEADAKEQEREAAAAERAFKSARARAETARRSADEARTRAERARAEANRLIG